MRRRFRDDDALSIRLNALERLQSCSEADDSMIGRAKAKIVKKRKLVRVVRCEGRPIGTWLAKLAQSPVTFGDDRSQRHARNSTMSLALNVRSETEVKLQ